MRSTQIEVFTFRSGMIVMRIVIQLSPFPFTLSVTLEFISVYIDKCRREKRKKLLTAVVHISTEQPQNENISIKNINVSGFVADKKLFGTEKKNEYKT